ncbi:hypothetical protein R80B4_02847 [Fibrobacteres bacterium R8-0-B4]
MSTTKNDVYKVARQKALKEFNEINKSEAVNKSLEYRLSNTSTKTDYEAWANGSKQFAKENFESMSRWVH